MYTLKSVFPTVKEVLSNRNILVTSVVMVPVWFFEGLYLPWLVVYMQELKIWPIQEAAYMWLILLAGWFFPIMGGVLADKYGRRKILLLGSTIRLFVGIFYVTPWLAAWRAGYMVTLVIASLDSPALIALIAESLPRGRRGTGYGVLQTLLLPTMLSGFFGGILIAKVGVVEWVRIGLFIHVAVDVVILVLTYLFVSETLRSESGEISQDAGKRRSFVDLLKTKGFLAMLLTTCFLVFSVKLILPYVSLYVLHAGVSMAQVGLIRASVQVITFILLVPGGILADRVGRRPGILFGIATSAFMSIGYLLMRGVGSILLLYVVAGVSAGFGKMEGPAWMALLYDLVPTQSRGRAMALLSIIPATIGIFSPFIGGHMWSSGREELLAVTSMILGVIATLIFYKFVKDPQTMKR